MGFMDGFRQGRDTAIAERKAEMQAQREQTPQPGCRVHGRRYDGCPLDIIEVEVNPGKRPAPPGLPGRRPRR
jgi:hypothetical protein